MKVILGTVLLAMWIYAQAASTQHLREHEEQAAPAETVWHPKVPKRSDSDQTYCAIWANKVVYGVAAWLRASPDERTRRLIIGYQTGMEDRDHPEVLRTINSDDGSHALIQVVTDGYDQNGHWFLNEDVIRWAEDVFFFGWQWAGEHPANDAQKHASTEQWLHVMHAVCLKDPQL